MKVLRILTLIIFLVLQSSCIIQSTQLNALAELLRENTSEASENLWSVRYSNYETIAYAVLTPVGVLFSNVKGDQILFDGWTINRIKGMGRHRLDLKIYDIDSVRFFARQNTVVSNHSCDKWTYKENAGLVYHSQKCNAMNPYINNILVKENGDISMIRQIVDEIYTPLTLTKLN